jgi:hypothetical protein
MAKKRVFEFIEVAATFADAPRRTITPSVVWFDTIEEAHGAVARALKLGAECIVSKVIAANVDHEHDKTLSDWPDRRHVRRTC